MKNRVDFHQVLTRRRFTVAQWLESEQIETLKQFKAWRTSHAHEYVFSEGFIMSATNTLKLQEMSEASKVTSQLKEQELKNGFVELPAEKTERKSKKQDTVNNPSKDE